MRKLTKISTGGFAAAAALALAACGGGEDTTTDEGTEVTDVDPGETDGTIDDTTAVDATAGSEADMGMESMPADTDMPEGEEPAADAEGDAEEEAGE